MEPRQQILALAELEGWRQAARWLWIHRNGDTRRSPPLYLNSLDAIARVRVLLSDGERAAYVDHLDQIVGNSIAFSRNWPFFRSVNAMLDATPAQHAEAILKAKSLWVEGVCEAMTGKQMKG